MTSEPILLCGEKADHCLSMREELESLRKMPFVAEWKKLEKEIDDLRREIQHFAEKEAKIDL